MSPGTLYVVGTPLGHLGDLSARVVETLRAVPVVAAEDTRRTRGLLSAIDAHPERLLSYHAHSSGDREARLLELLDQGRNVALVTDAGTPGVSDPGAALVARARAAGHAVVPIPGPSAVATALSAAGLPADRYLFLGFPPRKGKERAALLEQVSASAWTVVLFEAANRLADLLDDLAATIADREAVVCRELTKVHEEFRAGTVASLAADYREAAAVGEVTLVIAGGGVASREPAADPLVVAAAIRDALADGESRREVVRRVTTEFGIPRNEAYRLVMEA